MDHGSPFGSGSNWFGKEHINAIVSTLSFVDPASPLILLDLRLLRLIPTSGEMFFDGLPTSSLNLDALRSNITIIPQQPELIVNCVNLKVNGY